MAHFVKSRCKRFLAAALLLFLAASASAGIVQAQEIAVTLDPAQTEIHYTLGATAHSVHGTFKLKSGLIRLNPATGKASGAIVVDATSGNSGNDGRDSKMHREILESQTFPEIVFIPQQVKGAINRQGLSQAPSQIEVAGTFRIHGQDHDLTLLVPVQISGNQATASTQFSVPYQKWGMKNPSTFILRVKDTVDIDIHAVGRIAPAN